MRLGIMMYVLRERLILMITIVTVHVMYVIIPESNIVILLLHVQDRKLVQFVVRLAVVSWGILIPTLAIRPVTVVKLYEKYLPINIVTNVIRAVMYVRLQEK